MAMSPIPRKPGAVPDSPSTGVQGVPDTPNRGRPFPLPRPGRPSSTTCDKDNGLQTGVDPAYEPKILVSTRGNGNKRRLRRGVQEPETEKQRNRSTAWTRSDVSASQTTRGNGNGRDLNNANPATRGIGNGPNQTPDRLASRYRERFIGVSRTVRTGDSGTSNRGNENVDSM